MSESAAVAEGDVACPHCGGVLRVTVAAVVEVPPMVVDDRTIRDCEFGTGERIANALRQVGVRRVCEVAVMPDRELLRVKGFGKKSLRALRAVVPYQRQEAMWAAVQGEMVRYAEQQAAVYQQWVALHGGSAEAR